MLNPIFSAQWKPVELTGWARRAYGRKIFLESEGGTLVSSIKGSDRPQEMHLNFEVSGRMLVLAYCNEVQIIDELVAHSEFDHFIDLSRFEAEPLLDLELHLIPATFGEVKIHQTLSFFGKRPVGRAKLPEMRMPSNA